MDMEEKQTGILSWQKLLTLCGCNFIQPQTQENKLLLLTAPFTSRPHTYTWYLKTNEEIGVITVIKSGLVFKKETKKT